MLEGSARVFVAESLILPTGLVTAALLTRRLGPEGYGLFTLASVLIAWVELSSSSIFDRATVKFVGDARSWRDVGTAVVQLNLFTGLVATLAVWFLAAPVAVLFEAPPLGSYLRLFALDIPLFALARAHRQILTGAGSFRERAVVSAGRWTSRMVLIVLFVELGFSIEGAIVGSIGASFVELILGRFHVRPPLFRRTSFPLRRFLGYAAPLSVFALSMRFFDRLDLLMLKLLGGSAEDAGIYGAAQNLSLVPGIFALSFSPVLLAVLSQTLRAGDEARAKALAKDAMRLVAVLLPFAGIVAGSSQEIVELLFGSSFSRAGPVLSLLIVGGLALVMLSVATVILTAAGRPGATVAVAVAMVAVAAAGHLFAIPRWGVIGAALVTSACAVLGAAWAVLAIHRHWRVPPPAWTLLRSGLICGLAYSLAALWPAPGLWVVFKLSILGVGAVLALLLLGELDRHERAAAWQLLRRRAATGE